MIPLKVIAFAMILWGAWMVWGSSPELPVGSGTPDLRERASEIEKKFGLVVGVGPRESFQRAIDDVVTGATLTATPCDPAQAAIALEALQRALALYSKRILSFHLRGVYLASRITIDDEFDVGGTYTDAAIYLVTDFIRSDEDARWIERAFHHELSSFFYYGVINDASPGEAWDLQNPPGFAYPDTRDAQLRAGAGAPAGGSSEEWYRQGFVSDYGRSSKENDVNTYAELLMADPAQLMKLADRWPRIRGKAEILARFYARMDPQLEAMIRASAAGELLDSP